MIRRFGETVKSGQKYTIRPGAYAILARHGMILLTHQVEPVPEFQLPGGGIDPGEDTLPALHREVFEETGWSIDRPRRLGTYRRFTFMEEYNLWAEKICHVFLARPVLQHGPPRDAGHSAVWMTPSLAMDAIESDGDRAFLKQLCR